MLTKELGILIKSVITDNGFKYKKEIKGFSWTRRYQDRREEIVIGYRTFYPNMFQIYSPSVYLYFNEVETILKECLEKNNVKNIGGLPLTIQSVLRNIKGVDYSKFETKIHDEASFQIVAEEIKKIFKYGAIPFFERYQTLEEVHNYANQLSLEEYSRFFSGYGSLKMMIIKRLLNIDDYESYSYKMIQDWINTAKEYPQHFENLDKVVVDLKNVLDKM